MAKGTSQFEGLLDRYFNGVLEDHPVYANFAGLKSGEGKLGHATPEFEKRQEERRQLTLRELDEISPRDLTNDQQLDRLAIRSLLLREIEDYARGRHKLDPDAPESVLNVLLHELQRGEEEPERAARIFGAGLAQRQAERANLAWDWPNGARVDYERDVAACRAELDDATFAAAWAAGRALPLEQAIAEALQAAA